MAELIDAPRFSLDERNRRWARVRQAMAEHGMDAIITYPHTGHNAQWEADSRYLSHCGGGGSSTACDFPLEGDVSVFVLNRPAFWASVQDWVTDVRPSARMVWSEPIIQRLRELGLDRGKIGAWTRTC